MKTADVKTNFMQAINVSMFHFFFAKSVEHSEVLTSIQILEVHHLLKYEGSDLDKAYLTVFLK